MQVSDEVQGHKVGVWRPVASLPRPRTFNTVPAEQLMMMTQPVQAAQSAVILNPPTAPLHDLR
jgi:hypothetical protein